jgi:hypothetical protein
MKVTAKSVLSAESELGTTIGDVLKPLSEGNGISISNAVVLLKHATGKTNEDCLTMIDEEQGLILKVIEAYSNWISKAYTVAESGN